MQRHNEGHRRHAIFRITLAYEEHAGGQESQCSVWRGYIRTFTIGTGVSCLPPEEFFQLLITVFKTAETKFNVGQGYTVQNIQPRAHTTTSPPSSGCVSQGSVSPNLASPPVVSNVSAPGSEAASATKDASIPVDSRQHHISTDTLQSTHSQGERKLLDRRSPSCGDVKPRSGGPLII